MSEIPVFSASEALFAALQTSGDSVKDVTVRCIHETSYQMNLFVARVKRGVAIKKMLCYVLSMKP